MARTETLDPQAPPAVGYYIYGISRPGDVTDPRVGEGIGGAPVEAVVCDSLAAVVSAVRPGDGLWAPATAEPHDGEQQALLEKAIRDHEAVVEAVLAVGSIVPMRFGLVYPSREAVSAMLRREHDRLEAVLGYLTGSAEWTVRVTWDPRLASEAVTQAMNEGADAPELSQGHAYLAARRSERAQREELANLRADCALSLHDRLAAAAVASVRHVGAVADDPSDRELLLAASYLVRRDDEAAFAGEVESELARGEAFAMKGELTGPWPAYHFAEVPESGPG